MLENISENPLVRVRHIFLSVVASAFSESKLFSNKNPFRILKDSAGEFLKDSLIVADTYADELLTKNPRPLILFNRDEVHLDVTAVNNLAEKKDLLALAAEYQTTMTTNIILRCYGRNVRECETLAFAAGGLCIIFRNYIRIQANLVSLGHPSFRSVVPKEVDAKMRLFYCDVRMTVSFPFTWEETYSDTIDIVDFPISTTIYWDGMESSDPY